MKFKKGDICLIVGAIYNTRAIGRQVELSIFLNPGDRFIDIHGKEKMVDHRLKSSCWIVFDEDITSTEIYCDGKVREMKKGYAIVEERFLIKLKPDSYEDLKQLEKTKELA